jgi:hypothetical protein
MEELSREGAKITNKKRKLLDDLKVNKLEYKVWEDKMKKTCEEVNQNYVKFTPTEEEKDELGLQSIFIIKPETSYENISKIVLERLSAEFFLDHFPNYSPEDVKKIAKVQSEWMWKNRTLKTDLIIERNFSKAPKTERAETKKNNQKNVNIPSTFEEISGLPIMEAFLTSGLTEVQTEEVEEVIAQD